MKKSGFEAVAIVGPTASGKTKVGVELALRLEGEVVNYDSLQLYRHFDIGTAKPTEEEKRREEAPVCVVVEEMRVFISTNTPTSSST